MKVIRLTLRDFRSYDDWTLEPDPLLTVLVGPNAAGKTNAIEALQLITSGASFRHPKWDEIVRWGRPRATVLVRAEDGSGETEIRVDVEVGEGRRFSVNGVTRRRLADVAKVIPSVAFTPEDLALVKGPAERRRQAIDDLGTRLSATYATLVADYGRVTRHRNALLREDRAVANALEPWDAQLVALGSRLVAHRLRLLGRLLPRLERTYADLAAGEALQAAYESRWTGAANLAEPDVASIEHALRAELQRRRGEELARRVSLVGPHRDDIGLMIGGRDARTFGSQGQQRSVALAWKLAEVAVVEEVTGKKPLLLLDDVMSELDEQRREALTSLTRRDIQSVVTTTNLGYFAPGLLAASKVVELPG